jgi:GNAT superfamily N-acetyltransferase
VFVDESLRGRGIGRALLDAITIHPQLRGLNRLVLATRDGHSLYARYGFAPLENPERFRMRRR